MVGLWSAIFWVTLLRSAPVQGVSRPPHTASRDCRNGSPLARANPCAPAPEYGITRKKEQNGRTMRPRSGRQPAFLSPIPHAAQRAVPGWRGGLGRVGADLTSAGSMRPPPSPARHVSTAWLATTHARRETAHHHQRHHRSNNPTNATAHKSKRAAKKVSCSRSFGIRKSHFQPSENSQKPQKTPPAITGSDGFLCL